MTFKYTIRFKKVRESLYRLGEHQAFEKLKNVHEPGKLKIDYAIGDWSVCSQTQCGQIDGAQVIDQLVN